MSVGTEVSLKAGVTKRNVSFILSLIIFLLSCQATIKMTLIPEQAGKPRSSEHPKFDLYDIRSIAVLDFGNSPKKIYETFTPHPKFNVRPYSVFVYPFDDDDVFIASLFEKELIRTRKCQVVDRRKITHVLNELAFQLSGAIDSKTAKRVGKLLAADAILTGSVKSCYAHFDHKTVGAGGSGGFVGVYLAYVSVEVRLVSVETGEVIWCCEHEASSLDYLPNTLEFTNHDIIKNVHLLDSPLHGSNVEERVCFVATQVVRGMVESLLH